MFNYRKYYNILFYAQIYKIVLLYYILFSILSTPAVHTLVLQLIEKGIITLGLSDSTKKGTTKLSNGEIIFYLPNSVNEHGTRLPAYIIDSYWDGLNWL